MINVEAIMQAAREGMAASTRVLMVAHPDNSEVQVPAMLVTSAEGETSIALAKDVLEELDARMGGPRRRQGTVRLHDVASFCDYLARYQRPDTTVVYADVQRMTFEAVIDEHPIADATKDEVGSSWRGFRASYACPRSPEWVAWTQLEGKEMKQEAFADFIEARLEDLVAGDGFPKPTEVLAVARQLNIRTKGEFRREINPTNGDYILVNKTETTSDSTQIPRAFAIAIPVFEGGDRYQVEARIRFACGEAGPRFSYTLHRRAEIERDAFNGVRGIIASETKLPILSGTP